MEASPSNLCGRAQPLFFFFLANTIAGGENLHKQTTFSRCAGGAQSGAIAESSVNWKSAAKPLLFYVNRSVDVYLIFPSFRQQQQQRLRRARAPH